MTKKKFYGPKWFVILVIFSCIIAGQISTPTKYSTNEGNNVEILIKNGKDIITIHDPILIDGNADFATQVTENGWTGNGTEGNPYTIANLGISTDTDGESAIEIQNTDVYFVIRNCNLSATGHSDSYQNYPSGITLKSVSNGNIEFNTAPANWNGFYLYNSFGNILTNNTALENYYGFNLDYSNGNILTNNTAQANKCGFNLEYSDSNTFIDNIAQNTDGRSVNMEYSNHNTLSNNDFLNDTYGLSIRDSTGNTLTNNILTSNSISGGIKFYGGDLADFLQDRVTDNSVNGKPLVFLQGESHQTVFGDAGQIIAIDCSFLTFQNQVISNMDTGIQLIFSQSNTFVNITLENNRYGLYFFKSDNNILINNTAQDNSRTGFNLWDSHGNIITNNTAQNNTYGIDLGISSNNIITYNTARNNSGYGITLDDGTSSNEILHNNFYENNEGEVQASSDNSTNVFDYNFWANHTAPDEDSDGIVDISYHIDRSGNCEDIHPLVEHNVYTGPPVDSTLPIFTNVPADLTLTYGSTESSLIWIATDDTSPAEYFLYINGTQLTTSTWANGSTITFNIDDLDVGTYNYTIIVFDASGNSVSDTVIVIVSPVSEPTDDEPSDDEPTDDGGNSNGIPGFSLIFVFGCIMPLIILMTGKISRGSKK
ncbi:MAG: right-handed parallel beta-helix repeat-containing protein [Promethearchaeota archaeon]